MEVRKNSPTSKMNPAEFALNSFRAAQAPVYSQIAMAFSQHHPALDPRLKKSVALVLAAGARLPMRTEVAFPSGG